MSALPIVFLAFAHNPDAPLEALVEEESRLRAHLQPLAQQNRFQLVVLSTTDIEKLATEIGRMNGQLVLFHFSGHAGQDQLLLADGSAGSGGIAQMLAQQENLQLVFLNGCSTAGQVAKLQELGIPNVIASSRPVGDQSAMEFADQFFLKFCGGPSLNSAFKHAAGYLEAKTGQQADVHTRQLEFAEVENPSKPLWGLYSTEQGLNWKLPAKSGLEIIVRGASDRYNTQQVPVNEYLTQSLWEALQDYSDELEFYAMQAQKGKQPDVRKIRQNIMDILPAPLGEQVRKLFAAGGDTEQGLDRIGTPRLTRILRTYDILTDLLVFTLLSRLWDELYKKRELTTSGELGQAIRKYLLRDRKELATYDPLPLITLLRQEFEAFELEYFVSEHANLKELLVSDENFSEAVAFMGEMKQEIFGGGTVAADEIESFCVQAEKHLGNLFKALGFLAKYKLHSVKDIQFIKPRNHDPRYNIHRVKLDTVTAGLADLEQEFDAFAENCSVMMLREDDVYPDRLNLSPFIIDENAWTRNPRTKLFFFRRYDQNAKALQYSFVEADDPLVLKEQGYAQELIGQLNDFCKTVLKSELTEL